MWNEITFVAHTTFKPINILCWNVFSSKFFLPLLTLQCSTTCGNGIQQRDVFCQSGDQRRVDESECARIPARPPSSQTCRLADCPSRYRWSVADWRPVSKVWLSDDKRNTASLCKRRLNHFCLCEAGKRSLLAELLNQWGERLLGADLVLTSHVCCHGAKEAPERQRAPAKEWGERLCMMRIRWLAELSYVKRSPWLKERLFIFSVPFQYPNSHAVAITVYINYSISRYLMNINCTVFGGDHCQCVILYYFAWRFMKKIL